MSSNRWRRFAFFERSNIPLPKDITKELQLPTKIKTENHNYSFTISCCSNETQKTEENEIKKKSIIPKSVVNVSALVQSTCGFPTNQTLSSIQSSTTMDVNDGVVNSNHPFVFIFLSSIYTHKIFCLDVSSQCNNVNTEEENEYCGYFIPFPSEKNILMEDKIIQEHMYGEDEKKGGRVVGIASIGNANDDLYAGVISDDDTACGVVVYKNPHNCLTSKT